MFIWHAQRCHIPSGKPANCSRPQGTKGLSKGLQTLNHSSYNVQSLQWQLEGPDLFKVAPPDSNQSKWHYFSVSLNLII